VTFIPHIPPSCTYSRSGPTDCSILCCNLQRQHAKSSTSFSSKAFSVLQNFGMARNHQVYNGGLGAKFGYQKLLGSHDIEYECSRVSRAPCKEDPTVSAGKLIREQGGEQT
jgi:hypothetical protein